MAAYNRNSFYYLCVNEENNDCSSKLEKNEERCHCAVPALWLEEVHCFSSGPHK